MKITYFGHSCFKIEENGFSLVIDPFKDVPGYQNVKTTADMVLCSHEHFDHNAVSGVKFRPSGKDNPFEITMMQTYHDEEKGQKRGNNIVHIITCAKQKIVHLGDLGHLLNQKQLEFVKNCDLLLVPIGGTYTIDKEQAWQTIKDISPRVAVPMHYRNGNFGFENISTIAEFLTLTNRKTAILIGNEFEIPNEKELLLVPTIK